MFSLFTLYTTVFKLSPQLLEESTVPKHNMNLRIKTDPVTVGADAAVYVWFVGQIYVAPAEIKFGTVYHHSSTMILIHSFKLTSLGTSYPDFLAEHNLLYIIF